MEYIPVSGASMPGGDSAGPSSKKRRVSKEPMDPDDGTAWECTLYTYRNRYEAFKCEMCDTRKGTSTRKPKLNENVVERQKTVQNFVVQQQEKVAQTYKKERSRAQRNSSPDTSRQSPGSSSSGSAAISVSQRGNRRKMMVAIPIPDMFIYRSSPTKVTVIVHGVTATITEYRRKPINNERVGRRNLTCNLKTEPQQQVFKATSAE